jgi:Mg2+-importing ATPase
MTTLSIFAAALIVPFTPLAALFGFSPPPVSFLLLIGLIVLFYIFAAETVKKVFYKKVNF